MKKIILLSCFMQITCLAFTQRKNYLSVNTGIIKKNNDYGAIGGLSLGRLINTFAIGLGISAIGYNQLYYPITADLSYFGKPGKISPIAGIKIGHGLYAHRDGFQNVRGGLTGSALAGIAFPVKKQKLFLMAGYSTYRFVFSYDNDSYKNKIDDRRFTLVAGLKI